MTFDMAQECVGTWWIAGDRQNASPGALSQDGEMYKSWRLTTSSILVSRDEAYGFSFEPHVGRTLYGETNQGKFTLAEATVQLTQTGSAVMQCWRSWSLYHGDHLEPDALFASADFEFPGLINWCGPSRLNGHASGAGLVPPQAASSDEIMIIGEANVLDPPMQLCLQVSQKKELSYHSRMSETYAWYYVKGQRGLSIDEIEKLNFYLNQLHSLVNGRPIAQSSISFYRCNTSRKIVRVPLQEGSNEKKTGRLQEPVIDTSDIVFGEFIPRWLGMCEEVQSAIGAATPRDESQFIQDKILILCNGIEALYREIAPDVELSDSDKARLESYREIGVRSKDIRILESGFLGRKASLSEKLAFVASSLGERSQLWLLGPNPKAWAFVVAQLRNSIAHGGGTKLPIHYTRNVPLVWQTYMSVKCVLTLAILREAGFSNRLGSKSGELLWDGLGEPGVPTLRADGRPPEGRGGEVIGHLDSPPVHDMRDVRDVASSWSRIEREIQHGFKK